MIIVHVVPYFHASFGYQENHLVHLQAQRGHQVYVITSNLLTPWPSVPISAALDADKDLAARGVTVHRLPALLEASRRPFMPTLPRLLVSLQPDYVHVHGYFTLHCLQVATLRNRLHATLVVDDHMAFIASRHPFARLAHLLCRLFCTPLLAPRYDAIVAVTKESKAFMVERYGLRPEDVLIIPLGVDTSLFTPSSELRRIVRHQLRVGEHEILAVYTGKHDRYKDPLLALKAAEYLWAERVPLRFLFLGHKEPRYFSQFLRYAKLRDLEHRLILKDPVPATELPKFFNASDFAVWPAECSMSALEAMSCGCPVILPDLPANRERLEGGGGLLFRPGDVQDLAHCMRRLSSSPDLRSHLGHRARQYASSLSWESVCNKFLSLDKRLNTDAGRAD